jgi:cytochrome P450 family 135
MPTVWQAVNWARQPLVFMESCHRRFGDIFTLRIRAGRPWVFLTNPEHVRELFMADPRLLRVAAAEANPLLGPLLGPNSVTLLDEPVHMPDRRRILPSFHGECLEGYERLIVDVTRRQIAHWPRREPFAIWPRMQAISREILMRAIFTDIEAERMVCLRERLVSLTAWVNDPRRLALLAALGPRAITASTRFARLRRELAELVLAEVRERRARPQAHERRDILSMLERAHVSDGAPMSEEKVRDELVTLLSDGPTATSLAWAFEELLRHPEKLARLREEAREDNGDGYADAVVKETLRLCPAVPVAMRRLAGPLGLGGYVFPAETRVAACIYLMHLRADVYPDPRAFRPERFLESPPWTYTWIPFGGGTRRCIAASFSLLEMRRVMRTVIEEVELQPVGEPRMRAARSSVSFAPSNGALVLATPR